MTVNRISQLSDADEAVPDPPQYVSVLSCHMVKSLLSGAHAPVYFSALSRSSRVVLYWSDKTGVLDMLSDSDAKADHYSARDICASIEGNSV